MFPSFFDVGYGKRSALINSAVCPEFLSSEMVQLTIPAHASVVISVAWSARCFPQSAVCYISKVVVHTARCIVTFSCLFLDCTGRDSPD